MHIRPTHIDNASAAARRLCGFSGFAWLDARAQSEANGRWSFLAAEPVEQSITHLGESPFERLHKAAGGPVNHAPTGAPDGKTPAFDGAPAASDVPRWIGYIAYDAAWSRPGKRQPILARDKAPIVHFNRYDATLAVDHQTDAAWIVGDDKSACERLQTRLSAPQRSLRSARIGQICVDDPQKHHDAIATALDRIRAGDIYQVNLARRWDASFTGDPLSLWFSMRDASRVPLGMYMDAGHRHVLAATMERFLRWTPRDGRLVTQPIKGTIRRDSVPPDPPVRGDSPDGRSSAAATLQNDPKERAEHSMIVDLMRNDLGRVARIGTVQVDKPLSVEPFTGLYHLVSTVSCVTREQIGLQEVLEATFPPGSITGTPKLRAIEIIEQLEQHPRDVYCGASGFIDRDGGLSLAVSIRTATVVDNRVRYWAGGGIVEASDPVKELAETELKARVFLDAADDGSNVVVCE